MYWPQQFFVSLFPLALRFLTSSGSQREEAAVSSVVLQQIIKVLQLDVVPNALLEQQTDLWKDVNRGKRLVDFPDPMY